MSQIVFDPNKTKINEQSFAPGTTDWRDFYGEVMEELPPRMPMGLGRSANTNFFVDANHSGNVVTRQSHTEVLIYVMNTPIIWFSKEKNAVKSSTFRSEFMAMRIARDLIVALQYKLRIFGCH